VDVAALHDGLTHWAAARPQGEFALHGGRRLTYGEADAAANRLARALLDAGLRSGDRVAMLSRNSVEFALLYYAASRAGLVTVPLNCRLAPPEWRYILNDARARTILAAGEYLGAVDGLRAGLHTVEWFFAIDRAGRPGWEDLAQRTAAQPSTAPAHMVDPDDDLYQMYTSGTTGRPKGAVLTHRAVMANLAQIADILSITPGERSLVVAPMFHAAAVFTTFSCIAAGGSLYVLDEFEPLEVVRVLSEERIGFAVLVAAMIHACLVAAPEAARRRYDSLRLILYGASPIAEPTLRGAMEVFGCDFVQAYGMTEATVALTFLLPADHRQALAGTGAEGGLPLLLSAGRPLPGTEIRIVDEHDRPLPNGMIGEIVARGPQLMRGYFNQPEATAEALRGGWLHTGDAGVMDDERYLYVQDRVKDMIVSGGENVYPREVEEVLLRHPAILDAAVFGVPDERWGETVKAAIMVRAGIPVSSDAIIDFCRDKLGGFKRPRSVDFVAELPRNASGKVLKRVLREPYWQGHRRRVGGA
jgi:acyl-CoA synthetase (AMP-forming)/AMP-acid ligase II